MNNSQRAFTVILAVFVLYIIYQLARKLLGGSWGFEELTVGLLIANIGYSYHINARLSEHLGWHKGIKEKSSEPVIE